MKTPTKKTQIGLGRGPQEERETGKLILKKQFERGKREMREGFVLDD